MSFPPGAPVMVTGTISKAVDYGPDPRYIEDLRRRKEAITRLTSALHEFLSLGLDSAIQEASRPRQVFKYPRPTMEDLNRAQEEVDAGERQMDGLERLCEHIPEEMRQAYLDSQRPALERLLQPLKDRVAMIQKAMEEPEPEPTDPSSPWEGRTIGTMCTECATDFEQLASSPRELNPKLIAGGWRRDLDGDWLCPACVAKVKPQQDPTALPNPSTPTETGTQPKEASGD